MGASIFRSLRLRIFLAVVSCVLSTACSSGSSPGSSDGSDGGADGGGANDGGANDGSANDGGANDGGANDGGSDDGGADAGANDGGDAGSSTSIADYCQATAERYFTWLQTCYGHEPYPDTSRARAIEKYRTRCQHSEEAVAQGRLGYDGVQATQCLASIDTDDCVGSLLDDDACEGVFEGLVPNGEDCYAEESLIFTVGVNPCADGYCDNDGCPGTCQPFAARGDSCEDAPCGPDDFCHQDDNMCLARAGEGEACDDAPCVSGLTCLDEPEVICVAPVRDPDDECSATKPCSGPTVCVEGLCRARVELGQPCRVDNHCPEGAICARLPGESHDSCVEPVSEDGTCSHDSHCDVGLECEMEADASVGTCEIDPDEHGLNEPCADGHCQPGLWCRIDEATPDGACVQPVGEGESCLSDGSPSSAACIDGLHCTNAGTCQPPGNEGDPCNSNVTQSCVPGLWCDRATGLCATPAEEGSACNPAWPDATCGEGLGCDCGVEDRDACRNVETEPVATDTCQPAVPAGGSCFRDAECERGICSFDFEADPSTPGVCRVNSADCLP